MDGAVVDQFGENHKEHDAHHDAAPNDQLKRDFVAVGVFMSVDDVRHRGRRQ